MSDIFVYVGSKSPASLHSTKGDTLTSCDFEIDAKARYVRVSVRDSHGRWADTRGFFPDELLFN